MRSAVVEPGQAKALELIAAGIGLLQECGVAPANARDAITLIAELETVGRCIAASQIELVDEIDKAGLFQADGHTSAKVMVGHVARLSGAEAARRHRSARALRDLPEVADRFRAGAVPVEHVARLGHTHANPRVRAEMAEFDGLFAARAATFSFDQFHRLMTGFVDRADPDGSGRTADKQHANRNFSITQGFDKSFSFEGRCGSLQGAQVKKIFDHFCDAETLADLAETDPAAQRTTPQRRFDAFNALCDAAASAVPGADSPNIVTNIMIDADTFEAWAAYFANGGPTPARDPFDASYRCHTLDGYPIDVREATAAALVGHIRRVVITSKGVVTNLGKKSRFFTGNARLAAFMSHPHCVWPGCKIQTTSCQIDHLVPDRSGGLTNPDNAAPLCGKHNRLKERQFTVRRNPDSTWHTYRPDGTEIH